MQTKKRLSFKKVKRTKKHKRTQRGGNAYVCNSQLGKGTYGYVLACNKDDDKVAIKFAIKENADALQMLKDEIAVYDTLEKMRNSTKCINIVKRVNVEKINFELGIDTDIDTSTYLALERCDTDLDTFVRKNTYDISDITKQLFNGLLFLYKNNILHLDLKPANILVKSDGDNKIFKISDFGTAKIYNDISSARHKNVSCGTICYMPATNVHNVLFKTTFFRDLYAFFCIIYFICYLKHYNIDSLASQDKKQLLIDKINIPELDDKIIIHLINLQDALIKSKLLSINSHDNVTTAMVQKNNNNKNNKIITTPELYKTCYNTINTELKTIVSIFSNTIDKPVTTVTAAQVASFAMHS